MKGSLKISGTNEVGHLVFVEVEKVVETGKPFTIEGIDERIASLNKQLEDLYALKSKAEALKFEQAKKENENAEEKQLERS